MLTNHAQHVRDKTYLSDPVQSIHFRLRLELQRVFRGQLLKRIVIFQQHICSLWAKAGK